MHILSPATENCPTWISVRERMAIDMISWPISTTEYSQTGGSNPLPPDFQSKAHPTESGKSHVFYICFLPNVYGNLKKVSASAHWCSKLRDIIIQLFPWSTFKKSHLSQLMRLWYLSHRRPAKAQASLRIRVVSPKPLLFAHMKYGSRRRVRPNIRHRASLNGCACSFEEWVYGGRNVP